MSFYLYDLLLKIDKKVLRKFGIKRHIYRSTKKKTFMKIKKKKTNPTVGLFAKEHYKQKVVVKEPSIFIPVITVFTLV